MIATIIDDNRGIFHDHQLHFLVIEDRSCQEQGFRGGASITVGVEPTRTRHAARSDTTKAERSSDWSRRPHQMADERTRHACHIIFVYIVNSLAVLRNH